MVAWLTGCTTIGLPPAARVPAVTDLNAQEFFWNNDFGRNEFLH